LKRDVGWLPVANRNRHVCRHERWRLCSQLILSGRDVAHLECTLGIGERLLHLHAACIHQLHLSISDWNTLRIENMPGKRGGPGKSYTREQTYNRSQISNEFCHGTPLLFCQAST